MKNRIFTLSLLLFLCSFIFLFVACDEVPLYTITYVNELGSDSKVYVLEGQKVKEPEDPKVEGYNFLGWYCGGELFKFDSVSVDKDYTLIAKFEENIEKLEVVLINDESDLQKNTLVTIPVGGTLTISEPQKEGYKFIGWYIERTIGDEVKIELFDLTQKIESNITLIAKFEKTYTVTYLVDEQENKLSVLENEKISLEDPIKEGFEFVGWYNFDTNELFDMESLITSDIKLFAKFEEIENTFIVKCIIDDKETLIKVKENEKVVLDLPQKEGYNFIGFYQENGEEFSLDTLITNNITIIARFEEIISEPDKFIVTYIIEGVKYTQEVIENEKVNLDTPQKDNYIFTGWYLENNDVFDLNTLITENITITAHFEKKGEIYNVIFYDINGKEIKEEKVNEGNAATAPELENIPGYIFIEWDTDFSQVNSDIVVYPIYDVELYMITYIGGDEGDNPLIYTVETSDITLKDLEIDGYRFLGWYSDDKFTNKVEKIKQGSTGNLVLYPKTEEIKYVTFTFDLNGGIIEGVFNDNVRTEVNSYTITSYNGDFWTDYASEVFLFDFDKDPKAKYSLRIGLKEVDGELVVSNFIPSGTASSDNPITDCKYVLVVSENNRTAYNLVNTSLTNDLIVSISGLDKLVSGKVILDTKVYKESIVENKKTLEDGETLPIPTYKRHIFEGWFDEEGTKYEKVTRDMASEISIKAKWTVDVDAPEVEVERILEEYGELLSKVVCDDLPLLTVDEGTNAKISWSSDNESIITSSGKVTPVLGTFKNVTLTAVVTYGGKENERSYTVKVNKGYKDVYNGGVIAGYNYFSTIPDDTTLKEVDILYCAFGTVGTNGHIVNMTALNNYLSKYVANAHKYGDYVILCVNTSEFATVAASSELIKIFVNDVITCINNNNLDGIDIDWETPTTATKTNFTNLMRELYTKVKENNPSHLVTAATAGGPWQYPRFDLKNSIKYIDFINLMTYDLQTNSSSTHHNGLYKSSRGYTLTQCTIDQSIPLYNECNVPNSKILIGIPFYGRKFINTDGIGKPSSAGGSATQEFIYTNYLSKNDPNVILGFDDECKVPYIYDGNNRIFISYDDERSIACKAEYIEEKKLAGMMYWQNSQDYQHKLLNAMYKLKADMDWK